MSSQKHQKYLRILLGIIALNLTLLSLYLLNLLPQAQAHKGANAPVLPLDKDGVLRVRIEQEIVPVRIVATKDNLPVSIKEVDGFIFNSLPVKVKD